jgi:hypothetical protein
MDESEILKQELEHYKSEKERVWMISKQTKVEHFQFWILNSIEFQINLMSKKIRDIEDRLYNTQEPEQ